MSKKKDKDKSSKSGKGVLGTFLSIILFPFKLLFKFFIWLIKLIFKILIKAPLAMASGLLIVVALIALLIWLI